MKPFFILLFLFPGYLLAQGYTFVGDSYQLGGDCYAATANSAWQNGAIWYNDPIDLNDAFHLQFTANFGGDPEGADGMVFVMQQVGNAALGTDGEGMGFSGFSPSFGVEFDTFQNFNLADLEADHMAVLRQGNVNHNSPNNIFGPIPIQASGNTVKDGENHIVDIYWDPQSNLFEVWFDCVQRIGIYTDLLGETFQANSEVFWGFTAATGGFFNQHTICLDPNILGIPTSYETCVGEPVQFEATEASLGSYTWEPAEYFDDPTSTNPIGNFTETTSISVSYTDLCGNEQVFPSVVNVYEPEVSLGDDFALCANETAEIEPTGTFETLEWQDGSEGDTFTVSEPGEYTVTAISGPCEAESSIEITGLDAPEFDWESEVEICEGETYVVDLSNESYNLLWSNGSTDPIQEFDETGIYTLTATNGECTEDFTLDLTVNDLPVFDLGDDIFLCADNPTTLETGLTAADIEWNTGEADSAIDVNESGEYWAEAISNGCSYSDTVNVTFGENPNVEWTPEVAICEGETYLADLSGTPYTITWFDGSSETEREFSETGVYAVELSDGECTTNYELELVVNPTPIFDLGETLSLCDGNVINLETGFDEANVIWNNGSVANAIQISQAGTYWAELTLNGCSFSDTVVVNTSESPELDIIGEFEFCEGDAALIEAVSNSPIVWNTGSDNPILEVLSGGRYTAVATNEAGCDTEESVVVEEFPLPRITFPDSLFRCPDETLRIRVSSSNDGDLLWSDGTTGPVISADAAGTYTAELENECGLARKEIHVVDQECINHFYLPNAFTPDEDGINDIFKPISEAQESFSMRIYNRDGNLVFHSSDIDRGWNGSFMNNGYYCPAGVYAVKIIVDFGENEILEKINHVVLIR